MISVKERERLIYLRQYTTKRNIFCEGIEGDLLDLTGESFPEGIAPALEQLLAKVDPENPKREGILISGTFPKHTTRGDTTRSGYPEADYRVTISGKKYYLHHCRVDQETPDSLETIVTLHLSKATIEFDFQDRKLEKIVHANGGFFSFGKDLKKFYFENCIGVGLTTINEKRIGLGGKCTTLSTNEDSSCFIVVFVQGEQYIYDLFGDMVFSARSVGETRREKVLGKIRTMKNEAGEFDKENYITRVREHMISQWIAEPERFDRLGLTTIIEGTWTKQTDNRGFFSFSFYRKGKKPQVILVDKKYGEKPCRAEFFGRTILFYDRQKLVNSYQTDIIGFVCERMHPKPTDLEFIRLRNVDPHKRISFGEGDRQYIFRLSYLLSGMISEMDDDASYAVLFHRTREGEHNFTALVKTEQGIDKYKITPNYSKRTPH